MESMMGERFAELARLVELTSDAVALCEANGTVLHVNHQMVILAAAQRDRLVGTDIKDIIYSDDFERAEDHRMPFTLDGKDATCRIKLPDGSFVPIRVRARTVSPTTLAEDGERDPVGRILVVINSLEEQYTRDRQTQRLFAELQAVNRRLSGTLSVIMTAAGSKDLPSLLDAVLNKLVDALDADGSSIYFSESGGFKLRGVSYGLMHDYVPEFIPYGSGIPTYVLREQRPCSLAIVPSAYGKGIEASVFFDFDTHMSTRLRLENVPPYRTLIAVPVFFGTQVLGILELGWKWPCRPRALDARVLEVICDYLSIELVGLVSSLRAQRTEELTRSLNRMREHLFDQSEDHAAVWRFVSDEVRRVLKCRTCSVELDPDTGRYVIDFEGGSRVHLPDTIEDMFFSTTAPAARVDPGARAPFSNGGQSSWLCSPEDLTSVRLVRVDQTMRAGEWLASRGLPSQGVFFDIRADMAADGSGEPVGRTEGVPGMVLLLRDSTQEPVDDIEYDYLVRLAHDFEIMMRGVRKTNSERHIAQTLQVGLRSDLGTVPGITTDSLYSSATRQALVGGDFYTLIRLPDDRAVMILGDVSGKGIEAASMSALVKTALTAYAWEGTSPVSMVRSLNGMLMSFSRVETFATMFVAKIDLRAGVAEYCSAGHPPTVLIHPAKADPDDPEAGSPAEIELLTVQSGVVGAFEAMVYEGGTFTFEPGDILFMYTDGAIEARSPDREFFGERRLFDELLHASANGVEGLCGTVLSALDAFSDSELDDDIALVALRFDTVGASDEQK